MLQSIHKRQFISRRCMWYFALTWSSLHFCRAASSILYEGQNHSQSKLL